MILEALKKIVKGFAFRVITGTRLRHKTCIRLFGFQLIHTEHLIRSIYRPQHEGLDSDLLFDF